MGLLNHKIRELYESAEPDININDENHCPTCPDNRENIIFADAYQNAMEGGEKLYQDVSILGIELEASDFNSSGRAIVNMASPENLLKYGAKGQVQGNITFELMEGSPDYAQVVWNNKANCRCGFYDFEIHGTKPSFRNWATGLGGVLHTRNISAIFTGGPIYGPLKFPIQYTNVIKLSK